MIGSAKGRAVVAKALPLPLWQRLLITLATMLLTSFVAGLVWHWLFNANIPSYLSGLIGGITAVPVWELLKRLALR